jgi:hypothetical protein
MFQRNISLPTSGLEDEPSKKPTEAGSMLLVFCLAYSLTLKMDANCCSETLGCLYTTWCYNPEEHNLQDNEH